VFRRVITAFSAMFAKPVPQRAVITPRPDVLSGAFAPGFTGEAADKRYPIRVVRIGDMEVASGRVLLCDPFSMSEQDEPLALQVRPGRYPVDLAVADTGKSGQRVALARLLLSSTPAQRWVIAVTRLQDPATLKDGEEFGYGVDAGIGAFVDAAVPAWLAVQYPSSDFERYQSLQDDWLSRGEAAAEALEIPHGFTLIERLGHGDAAMFSSGWGDGFYTSWVGYGQDNDPVAIVTDFVVIDAVTIPTATRAR
jgi:hypothetical protein